MTGCQAGFSVLQIMNAQSKKVDIQDQSKRIDDPNQKINGRSPRVIDSLYEARMIIHVTGPANKKVRFQEAQQEKDAKDYSSGADLELDVRVLEWMSAVQIIEVVHGLSLGKRMRLLLSYRPKGGC
jgi:hypothetical protein